MKGKVVHIELPADDTGRAKEFWGKLASWEFAAYAGPVEYHMFEGEPGGGIYPRQQDERGVIVYFETDDIDRTVAEVRELGGSADDKQPIPEIGWYARCKDTEDNPFSVYQSDESAPSPAG